MAFTAAYLRHVTARLLGDHTGADATAVAAGSITDANRRTEVTDYWKGAYLKLWSGTDTNQERRISTSSSAGVLSVSPNWSPTPSGTVSYEIHRYYDGSEYDEYVKEAMVHLARTRRLLDPKVDTSLTWTTDQYDYTVPSGFVGIETVEFSTETGSPDTDEYTFKPVDNWYIRQSTTRKLVFNRSHGQPAASTVIRLTGWAEPTYPTADTDSYDFDPLPVCYLAASHAALGLAAKFPAGHWRQVYDDIHRLYEDSLTRIPVQTPSNVKWVYNL